MPRTLESSGKFPARPAVGRMVALGCVVLLLALLAAAFMVMPSKVAPERIASAVDRDPALLEKAWHLPVAAKYRRTLEFQSNGSVCGPASLANVFRSLAEPAASEVSVLEGTGLCRTGYCLLGLSLDQLAQVARRHTSRKVSVLRDLTPDAFRRELLRSNDPNLRYVINFSRRPIFDGGGGHHSPIGGYLEAEDLAFVLDVNRDFQPWLVSSAKLFGAMSMRDGDIRRGLLRIE
jgi:Phytochelatin synthase